LVLVAGLAGDAGAAVAERVWHDDPGSVLVHHDLARIAEGIVRRRVRRAGGEEVRVLELAHGCVSCTLREDLLPLLHALAPREDVTRIVLHLDSSLEPEAVCWALRDVVVAGSGDTATTVADVADVEAVVTVVDRATWLTDASGDTALVERGLGAAAEDERTVAQVVVGQVEFADALVLTGPAADAWSAARTDAVLDRLAPRAPRHDLATLDVAALLAAVPADARRGEPDHPHGPLLRGQPPLEPDCGVSVVVFTERRPFHPERLHDALDVLLDGTVRARGRIWVASQPDVALWLESAGGGLRIGHAGPWLAAVEDWSDVDAERRAMASLDWDPYYGDRSQNLVVIAHLAAPGEITAALRGALLTDEELAQGSELVLGDPFGDWHEDPCADAEVDDLARTTRKEEQ
jgi:G3E family GTPase